MNSRQDTELQQLHQLSRHQLSDLMFLDNEMRFIESLMCKFFMQMIHHHRINRVQLIKNHLSELNLVKANVIRDVLCHQGELFSHTNGVIFKSIEFLKLMNERLEVEISDLNRSLRNIKKEVFAVYKEQTFQQGGLQPAVN